MARARSARGQSISATLNPAGEPLLASLDAVVLAGGLGTRLRTVLPSGVPKPLAAVAGRPFLQHVLELLYRKGLRRVTLAIGHGAAAVRHFVRITPWPEDLVISESVETTPLGTGGALRLALKATRSEHIVALNGDTIADLDLARTVREHTHRGARITMALTRVDDTGRYGRVELAQDGAVRSLKEKGTSGPGLINAGLYVVEREVLSSVPAGRVISWERDILPGYCERGLFGDANCERFLDIGTPESLVQAEEFLESSSAGNACDH